MLILGLVSTNLEDVCHRRTFSNYKNIKKIKHILLFMKDGICTNYRLDSSISYLKIFLKITHLINDVHSITRKNHLTFIFSIIFFNLMYVLCFIKKGFVLRLHRINSLTTSCNSISVHQ